MATLHLEIVTQERRLFSGDVDMVVAPGGEGELGILPHHAPLLTTLKEGALRVKQGGGEEYFSIGGGFMEVRPDRVTVLADAAESADEIDEQRAAEARKRAQELMAQKDQTGADLAQAALIEQSFRRAELRLKVARRRRGGTQE